MHPWTRTLHQNYMRAAMTRPPRTRPLAPRARRGMGWFADSALAKLKAELQAMPGGPSRTAKDIIAKIDSEQAERLLDPKEV